MSAEPVVMSMIVAAARNGVIGRDNALPWRLPDDLRYFRRVTMGKPVIMGRRTFESIGRPLPGRDNIVVSRNPQFRAAGTHVVHDLDQAYALARDAAYASGAEEVMLLGGAQLYAAALPQIQRIYLTQVHADISGDAFLPALNGDIWHEMSRQDHAAGNRNEFPFSFIVLERQ